jgi:chromosome segregation ATPase
VTWQETVETHSLWTALQHIRELCQSDGWPEDAEVREVVTRARWLCANAESRKDVNALTLESLNAAYAATQTVADSLAALRADPPATASQDVNVHIDQVLVAISGWPDPNATRISQALREGTEQHQQMADAALAALQNAVSRQTDEIATAQQQWQQQADERIANAADLNDRLKAEVDAAASDLTTQKQRLDSTLNDFAANSRAAEKERDAAETAAAKVRDDDARRALEQLGENGTDRLNQMNQLLEQARTTLQTIGKEASASHYGTYANAQRSAAFRWALGVLGALAAAAGFLVWAAVEHGDTWHSAAARYALVASFPRCK